jgi:hypothetical protein
MEQAWLPFQERTDQLNAFLQTLAMGPLVWPSEKVKHAHGLDQLQALQQ